MSARVETGYDPNLQDMPFEDRTVPSVLARTVAQVPDNTFVSFEGRSLTYREFDELTNRFARFALDLGLAGGKLALMVPTCLEFLYAWFGSAKVSCVYVPINTEYRGEILRHQLAKADVTYVLLDAEFLPRLAEVLPELPALRGVILVGDADVPVAVRERLDVRSVREFLDYSGAPVSSTVRHDDHVAISFTSGTTGLSKGVLSTHCHVVSFSLDWLKLTGYGREDSTLCPMPLFHALGAWLGVLPVVIAGARIVLLPRFSASTYWDDARAHRTTVVLGIFSVVPVLLRQPERPDDRDNPVRLFYIGLRNREFEERFGVTITNAFGATETAAVTYVPVGVDAPEGTCGKAHLDKYEVKIVDGDMAEVGVGEVGEIVVRERRRHTLMEGYYNDPEATARAFTDGWFHTGDNARRDAEGWFYFVDRKKDSIRVRGENVSSYDVEVLLTGHPDVEQAAAIPIPSELGEDDVKVYVVRRRGAELSHEDLHGYCREKMPRFWVPKVIEFIDDMPLTPTKKIMKYRLREDRENGEVRTFGR